MQLAYRVRSSGYVMHDVMHDVMHYVMQVVMPYAIGLPRAHAGGEQRLVGVAPRGVSEEQPLVLTHSLGEGRRATGLEDLRW